MLAIVTPCSLEVAPAVSSTQLGPQACTHLSADVRCCATRTVSMALWTTTNRRFAFLRTPQYVTRDNAPLSRDITKQTLLQLLHHHPAVLVREWEKRKKHLIAAVLLLSDSSSYGSSMRCGACVMCRSFSLSPLSLLLAVYLFASLLVLAGLILRTCSRMGRPNRRLNENTRAVAGSKLEIEQFVF